MIEEIINKISKWFGEKNGHPPQKISIVTEKENEFLDHAVILQLKKIAGQNDPAFLKDIADMFGSLVPDMIREMEEGYLAKDFRKMGLAAHKLKGSALNIGAKKLAEACRELEINGINGTGSNDDKLIASIKFLFEKTMEELKKLS